MPNHFTILSLIASNSVPLFGVIFLGWDLLTILFVYWVESAVIGLYNVMKLVKIGGMRGFALVPFFIFHYGIFMTVHLVFLVAMFGPKAMSQFSTAHRALLHTMANPKTGNHSQVVDMTQIVDMFWNVRYAILALLISHGISYYVYFIRKQEYENMTMELQMQAPYMRILLMQFTLIFGGWIVMLTGAPTGALVIMIGIKIFIDVRAHRKAHAPLPLAKAS